MPLNIHVEAEPESIRGLGRWLRGAASQVSTVSDGVISARSASHGGWTGDAGDGFRAVAYRISRDADLLDGSYVTLADAVDGHAGDIVVVRDKMNEARDIASNVGPALY